MSEQKRAEDLVSQELRSPGTVTVTADVTPIGVDVEGSKQIGEHAAVGGFFSRTWKGVKSAGVRFKFSK